MHLYVIHAIHRTRAKTMYRSEDHLIRVPGIDDYTLNVDDSDSDSDSNWDSASDSDAPLTDSDIECSDSD